MEEGLSFPEKPKEVIVSARFILDNDDSISIHGKTIAQVFFEMHRRFPDNFKYKSIQFSGKDQDDARKNMQEFVSLINRHR